MPPVIETAPPAVAREGATESPHAVANGTIREVDGKTCIHFDGYWIRHYNTQEDSLADRRNLIDTLTRRVFHHTEPGINTPGYKLESARRAYDAQTDPRRRRVNAAMLAGALLNRATDIFTKVVELQNVGVEITADNELLRECGRCFLEALELGKQVKHYSGEEGLDELWGEPLKAFSMPVEKFYEGRYIKVAQTMANIDRITERIIQTFTPCAAFAEVADLCRRFACAARLESETLRSDEVIFDVWPEFVAAGDALQEWEPDYEACAGEDEVRVMREGTALVRRGKDLLRWIASARVPMPKSTRNFLDACDEYAEKLREQSFCTPGAS
ncbi:MAG: hypothetical protein AB7Q97_08695 [Gammaproteobacteria bacterium]